MKMQTLDFLVIALYLALVAVIGVIARRQAGRTNTDYLLGGKSIPYWMLGISNASGMFDISGTAWMVSIMFVYGVKSVWLPWLWPVFNQVFLMVYLSMWLRKSNASTGAEWMLTRFGNQKDSRLSHSIIVVFALLSCIGFMTYAFIGLGKFLEIFIPWSAISEYVPFSIPAGYVAHFYGFIFTIFTVFYSLLGGMKSIVWADLAHYIVILIISVSVAIIAMHALSGTSLSVPKRWDELSFGRDLDIDWNTLLPEAARKISDDNFSPFGYFFALMATKGILASLAGPMPSYDMQKILSARSPREAALMSMLVNFALLPTRYLLITGVAVLGLLHYRNTGPGMLPGQDFERLLPAVLNTHIPSGLLGLALVGLLGSFMGTFAGTFNAAQAYLVNDIYLKSINPNAGNSQVRRMNYLLGLAIVLLSVSLGFVVNNINSVLLWIVAGLYGGYLASNVLKFHWWRFNNHGFFWGMIAGIVCALSCPYLFPGTNPLYYFPVILFISLVAAVTATFLTPPTDMQVLKAFYKNVNPWGWWKPVAAAVCIENPDFVPNKNFPRDAFNIVVGIIAQTSLTLLPVYIVLLLPSQAAIVAAILLACAAVLRNSWYKKLPN
ncbi:sodium:solute symporter family protein [Dyadobacter sp. CY343]|uniref:sodium:solute symporter family protein n=1 Tax=Dyadobacter sp. CY343 TaxID=2907299 RepID=UPI001F21CA5B|nr:sodium:solute symporter family protein [Dyadobacter sp. CY343]MCE7063473.1 Na+:solute symporter [Dyadobacter sp. CY343]